MQISVNAAALDAVLVRVKRASQVRENLPILAYVKISVADGIAKFSCTDLERETSETLPCEVFEGGTLLLRVVTLASAVRRKTGTVTIESAGEKVQLTLGALKITMPALSADEWPRMILGDVEAEFEIPASSLCGALSTVAFAISKEETRYYLNGIYLHSAGENLAAVATDGHRLGLVTIPLPSGADALQGSIIPRAAVADILAIFAKSPVTLLVRKSGLNMTIRAGSFEVAFKLIDGAFPDYARVIPRIKGGHSWTFESAEATLAAQNVRGSRAHEGVGMRSNCTKITMSCQRYEDDVLAEQSYDAEIAGTETQIGFQARYLLDVAKQISGKMTMSFADPASPTLVTDAGRPSVSYVLMPMRL